MIVPFLIHREAKADCCRPAIACDKKGLIWISWDQGAGPGNQNIFICSCEKNTPGEPIQVTSHSAADLSSALAVDPDNRLWIAWHSNRRGNAEWDIPRWFQLRCYDKGKFYEPIGEPTAKNLDKEGTDQSFEFVRLFCGEDGKILITGRASHNFFVQYYQGKKWSPLYRLPVDGWGGRGQFLQGAFDPKGDLWVVRRDIRSNVLQQIAGLKDKHQKPRSDSYSERYFSSASADQYSQKTGYLGTSQRPGRD